ncbi:MAG: hypothetical protein ACLRL6_04610 [Clostridium sp.]
MRKKSYNFKPKGKRDWTSMCRFPFMITEECHGIRIHGKIFETETRTLRNGRDIQMPWIGMTTMPSS